MGLYEKYPILYSSCRVFSLTNNSFYLMHKAAGNFQIYAFSSVGIIILSANFGSWSAVADQIYEFELNYDFNLQEVRLFIDGT